MKEFQDRYAEEGNRKPPLSVALKILLGCHKSPANATALAHTHNSNKLTNGHARSASHLASVYHVQDKNDFNLYANLYTLNKYGLKEQTCVKWLDTKIPCAFQ